MKFCHHILTLKLFKTCTNFFLLLNTKGDIWKNGSNRTGPIDFHSIFFFYYGSQWVQLTVWLLPLFKIASFVFSRRKKFIQV